MAAIQIIDDQSTVKFILGSKVKSWPKGKFTLEIDGDFVIAAFNGEKLNINFQDVTVPAGITSAESLRAAIEAMLDLIPTTPPIRSGQNTNITTVDKSGTSVQLIGVTPNRIKIMIHNDSNRDLYIKLGATASLTDFSLIIPLGLKEISDYAGRIDGIWVVGGTSGKARITEILP